VPAGPHPSSWAPPASARHRRLRSPLRTSARGDGRGVPQEMNDFLADLGDWTNEVQSKDDALKQGKAVPAAAAPAPAPAPRGRVRNTVKEPPTTGGGGGKSAAKREKARAAEAEAKAKASAAGHTYDYFRDKWDKFDVDAALEEVDNDSEDEGAKRNPARGGSILRGACRGIHTATVQVECGIYHRVLSLTAASNRATFYSASGTEEDPPRWASTPRWWPSGPAPRAVCMNQPHASGLPTKPCVLAHKPTGA
jgi:hypothetical protein